MRSSGQYRKALEKTKNEFAHYEIEGEPFLSVRAVNARLRNEGLVFSRMTVYSRLRRGDRTWEQLKRPVKVVAARKSTAVKKHEEMKALIAALDARKKELPV